MKSGLGFFVYNLNSYSGAAQQALLLGEYLPKKPIIFNCAQEGRYKRYCLNGCAVIDLPNNTYLKIFLVSYYIFKLKIKILHLHGFFPWAIYLGAFFQRKVILKTTLIGDDDFKSLEKRNARYIRLIKTVEVNIAVSNQIQEINEKYISKKIIFKISNGVMVPKLDISLLDKENIFCCVGLVCKRKRTYNAIDYFIKNYFYLPGAIMYVVGPCCKMSSTEEYCEEYTLKCKDLIRKYKADDKIIFTGILSKNELQNIYRKSKALLFFSSREGMPNVILESMAHNCIPIVNGRNAVVRELVEDNVTGFILSDDNHNIHINNLDEVMRSGLAQNSMKKVSIDEIAKTYLSLYKQLEA